MRFSKKPIQVIIKRSNCATLDAEIAELVKEFNYLLLVKQIAESYISKKP